MAAVMNNVTLTPGGGWTALTSANITSFLRLSKLPEHAPVFLYVGGSAPASTVAGFRWIKCETFFQGAISGNVYARISNNANDKVIVSVFAN